MSTTGPSDAAVPYSHEAVRAGMEALRGKRRGVPMRRERDAVAVLVAAYAIDEPRIRAESRAEMLAEVVAFVRTLNDMYRWNEWICEQITAKFNENTGRIMREETT